jgi:hypothetical protein
MKKKSVFLSPVVVHAYWLGRSEACRGVPSRWDESIVLS